MEPTQKICPSCKKEFECLHNSQCWCLKYSINENNRDYLASHYNDCLCEECLKKFADIHNKK